jgi:hypothetical protein
LEFISIVLNREAEELAEVEAKLVCFFPLMIFTFNWNGSSLCLCFIIRMLIGKLTQEPPKVVARYNK